MLIKLHGRSLRALSPERSPEPFLGRVCTNPALPAAARSREILLVEGPCELPGGFRAYLTRSETGVARQPNVFFIGAEFPFLGDGDIIRIHPERSGLTVLYRRSSAFNSMLVTERCDNYCVMCSQPPKERDDGWLVDELFEIIPMMSPETPEIGITGGEPGLLGSRLVDLVDRFRRFLPRTALHILSNGRAFADEKFALALAKVGHPDLMLGIPLYGDLPEVHDFVVQARGAFDQTIRGILNLKRHRVRVELRFVVQRDTVERLPAFARFVARNLLFVDHVALMGLELMGFARSNLDAIWIDPLDYQRELAEAVEILDRARMHVSIYNHQLCVLDPVLHRFARASISDWKNLYLEECARCEARARCGGFFASSVVRRSRGIAPFAIAEQSGPMVAQRED
ncbi:His-Xaa-Ser system radical SAM maturase HxsC [Nannocystis bainbridge]|uniref:His-Xaa-Ser system radical SAM maturase HxsC n=1 Tax=Nannocystis bainbridge TaxID=2995303 RepID=A0ABT5E7W9_9BACT|nr:His-Xaa-Ser system radical SAM maturase HxsC [Nannocystis bainbridge]MDC0721505.1 His-Xaa-Ser system radical SAM maturase HxsC [Nannocystis bainbridge]